MFGRLDTYAWRRVRWLVCAVGVASLWACGVQRLSKPLAQPAVIQHKKFAQTVNHKIDLLFMIDNSNSMQPLQTKMAQRLPDFMTALIDPVTGAAPDMHVAVISSSLGAGSWGGVPQCDVGHPGNDDGKFQQGPGGAGSGACPALMAGETYLISGDGTPDHPKNFTGDIATVFSCMALLGDQGCGFESQFASTEVALERARKTKEEDPANGGFLRKDAFLAIVMFTNEDDCSVDGTSLLLDPYKRMIDTTTNLGGLQSYRCNQFGHICDGMPLPLLPPGAPITYTQCVSAENDGMTEVPIEVDPGTGIPDPTQGHLMTVAGFSDYVKSLKTDDMGNPEPDKVLVAAIAGLPTPYVIDSFTNMADGSELEPEVQHSCVQAGTNPPEYADPAVRIKQWVDGFGLNGVFEKMCSPDYSEAMRTIATAISKQIGASCVSGRAARQPAADGTPDPNGAYDCTVTLNASDTSSATPGTTVVPCATAPQNTTCWNLLAGDPECTKDDPTALRFQVCANGDCNAPPDPSGDSLDANIYCALTN